jgi:hypothetical protein
MLIYPFLLIVLMDGSITVDPKRKRAAITGSPENKKGCGGWPAAPRWSIVF